MIAFAYYGSCRLIAMGPGEDHYIRRGKVMRDKTFSACKNIFSRPLHLQDFFPRQFPCTIFLWGVEGGEIAGENNLLPPVLILTLATI